MQSLSDGACTAIGWAVKERGAKLRECAIFSRFRSWRSARRASALFLSSTGAQGHACSESARSPSTLLGLRTGYEVRLLKVPCTRQRVEDKLSLGGPLPASKRRAQGRVVTILLCNAFRVRRGASARLRGARTLRRIRRMGSSDRGSGVKGGLQGSEAGGETPSKRLNSKWAEGSWPWCPYRGRAELIALYAPMPAGCAPSASVAVPAARVGCGTLAPASPGADLLSVLSDTGVKAHTPSSEDGAAEVGLWFSASGSGGAIHLAQRLLSLLVEAAEWAAETGNMQPRELIALICSAKARTNSSMV